MIKKPILYLDSAIQKVSELLDARDCQIYEKRIRAYAHLLGADEKLKMISIECRKESLKDTLREIDIALIFKALGFELEVEPGKSAKTGKNIDLKLSKDNNTCFVEVTRFMPMKPGPVEIGPEFDELLLPEYGDITRDVEKACGKVIDKFNQLGSEPTIIAIWNDDNRMEEIEVGMAVRKIVQVEKVPSNLMFILYISDWIKIRGQQQMFCYLSRNSLEPYVQQWIKDLESSLVQTLINDACRVLTSTI
jgi:hypothetical protein